MPARQRADRQAPATQARQKRPEILAFLLSLMWLVLVVVAGWALAQRGTPPAEMLVLVLVALAVFLPVLLIWQIVYLLRAADDVQQAAAELAARAASLQDVPEKPDAAMLPTSPLDPPSSDPASQSPDPGLRFASRRHEALPAPGNAQGALALTPRPADLPDIGHEDLIRALHFPEDEHDSEGFAALRRALGNHVTAELIRSAQAVLTGLALEGMYMDRLTPDPPRPDIWRAFARGERGPAIAAMGGLRDRSCLALSAARMRADHDFREAAHRFLRAFDRCLRAFEPQADDEQLARLAATRSARAFMLLGRVSGVFR